MIIPIELQIDTSESMEIGIEMFEKQQTIPQPTKKVIPTASGGIIKPDEGFDYLGEIEIAPIPVVAEENEQGGNTVYIATEGKNPETEQPTDPTEPPEDESGNVEPPIVDDGDNEVVEDSSDTDNSESEVEEDGEQ